MNADEPFFPGAACPERRLAFTSRGLHLSAAEWGDPERPPLLLAHGMWDHVHSFAVLAPLLAERFRVIALDASGHGDSAWADAYTWMADVQDLVHVIRSLGRPVHLVGHSKGGGQVTSASRLVPEHVRQLVNIDGFGPPPFPPFSGGRLGQRLSEHVDSRRRSRRRLQWRPYSTLDQLIERRHAQNPRLSREWLRFFCFHGARRAEDGWRWKADPLLADGFGPWRPEWITEEYATVSVPMLAITGSEPDTWGPLPAPLLAARIERVPRVTLRTIQGAGHFVHIEKPAETARVILDFLEL